VTHDCVLIVDALSTRSTDIQTLTLQGPRNQSAGHALFLGQFAHVSLNERLHQPALCSTLRRIRVDGADVLYTADEYTKDISAIVHDAGGRMVAGDLKEYAIRATVPLMLSVDGMC
jgi:gamma-glutamyltranspeptidase